MKKKPESKKYTLRRSIGVPADIAGAELERIASERGGLTPRALVDEARPKGSPMHPAFEWDNGKAGELYRIDQARQIIKSVHVVEDGEDAGAAFYHVAAVAADDAGEADGNEASYQPIARIRGDKEMIAGALRTLKANLSASAKGLADLERRVKNAEKAKKIANAGRSVGRAVEHLQAV